MKEIYPNLWIGNDVDANDLLDMVGVWAFVHAAKEPWHREAVGYAQRGAPRDSPEFYVARRGFRLALNLIDTESALTNALTPIIAGIEFITEHVYKRRVLVNCNQGFSRAPAIGLFWLHWHVEPYIQLSFEAAEIAFRGVYPEYAPKGGIRGVLRERW